MEAGALTHALDHYTRMHSENVSRYACMIGARLGLGPDRLQRLEIAGRLHDIGKLAVPDVILLKQGKLSADEFEVMKGHAAEGERIVLGAGLADLAPWIHHHHERWDGHGYPHAGAQFDPAVARALVDLIDESAIPF